MCTGLEIAALASAAAGTVGSVMQSNAAQNQQEAMVAASNDRLEQFLARNADRAEQAQNVYQERQEAQEPANANRSREAAEADSRKDLEGAAERAAPAAALPIKGSTQNIIGDVFAREDAEAQAASKDRAGALATTMGFGDSLFANNLANADAGRKIQTTVGNAQSDAAMLPHYQDFASGAAAIRNRPSGIGGILSGLGTAGSYYAGSGGRR